MLALTTKNIYRCMLQKMDHRDPKYDTNIYLGQLAWLQSLAYMMTNNKNDYQMKNTNRKKIIVYVHTLCTKIRVYVC